MPRVLTNQPMVAPANTSGTRIQHISRLRISISDYGKNLLKRMNFAVQLCYLLRTMLTLTVLMAAQSMAGKAGDPLMRPMIPDPFLVRQQWAQQELNLSLDEVKRISDEASRAMPTPRRLRISASDFKYDQMNSATKKYEPRIRQLSIWVNDVFAFNNEWVQSQTGLDLPTRDRVDGLSREFYRWYQAESDRLNKRSFGTDTSKVSFGGGPMRQPDEMVTLKRIIALRKQIRSAIPRAAIAKLEQLRGPAPSTTQPFGFPRAAPYVYVPYVGDALANPRVHEELGFTMKQSRLALEAMRSSAMSPDARKRIYAQLSPAQRKRLRQLELQMMGQRAILCHDVQAALGVDGNRMDDAYLRIAELAKANMGRQDEEQRAYSALYADNSLDSNARMARMEKVRQQYAVRRQANDAAVLQAIQSALTTDQIRRWNQMLGAIIPELKPKYR